MLAFWIIYVLTRPLGASLGDLLAQRPAQGGLGLGTTLTSVVFLVAIAAVVVYLARTRADVTSDPDLDGDAVTAPVVEQRRPGYGLAQTVVVVSLLVVTGAAGYAMRTASLQRAATAPAAVAAAPGAPAGPNAGLGDLSTFRGIAADILARVQRGDQAAATGRATDLETAWDQAQGRLQARDPAAWTRVDTRVDDVLTAVRADAPDPRAEQTALHALLAALT